MGTSRNFLLACGLMLAGSSAQADDLPAITPVPNVDLPRFMGDWYVIATIPSWFEKDAWNPVETYRLEPDGRIDTLYRYRKGGFDGARKEIASTGFVTPGTGNAVWGVQLLWPIKAQYLITYVNDDYTQTIIARDKRDYVWVMARTPTISQADYDALVERVRDLRYPMERLRKVPQDGRP